MYIVINGGGKVGSYLAGRLLRSGNEVALIERDQKTADALASTLSGRYLVVCGDGCMSRYQEDANIRNADVFVATTGQDESNLMSCEIASRTFNVPRVIARVNSPKNLRIFREVGIEAVSSTTLIATIIEEDAMLGGISVLSTLSRGSVALNEVVVPHMRNYSEEEGVLALDVDLPDGALLVAVSGDEEDDMEVVGSDTRLYPGDVVVVAADTDLMADAVSIIRGL
ncbi:MAG: TrkA family potassium uptake protein [Eggerthellaceae bacterium]|nr:TrkA family potassium uptake protein [Eggerthellaceae bacterium]